VKPVLKLQTYIHKIVKPILKLQTHIHKIWNATPGAYCIQHNKNLTEIPLMNGANAPVTQ